MTINSKVLKISMTLLVAINLKATPRNLLLAERSRKPGLGEIHGGERGLVFIDRVAWQAELENRIAASG